MADQNMILHSNVEPKRDSYGFAVRPQHLQRYREYGNIYKEEEEERSEKWADFLEQCAESAEPCAPVEEQSRKSEADATISKIQTEEENPRESDDSSSEKPTCSKEREEGSEKSAGFLEQCVDSAVPCVPVQEQLSPEAAATTINTECHQGSPGEWDASSGGICTSDSSKQGEQRSEKSVRFLEQRVESDEACVSVPEAITSNIQPDQENSGEKDDSSEGKYTSESSKEREVGKEVLQTKEAKRRKIKSWASIRESLVPIEKLMSVRVKSKGCVAERHVHLGQKHLPSIDEEKDAYKNPTENLETPLPDYKVVPEDIYVDPEELADSTRSICNSRYSVETRETSDTSCQEAERPIVCCQADAPLISISEGHETSFEGNDDKQEENNACNWIQAKPFFPSKEELESLVHGGVPKSLRGEVWQAFVGVQARRVESYYQELLSGMTNSGSTSCASDKYRKQIEKDLPRTFPGHPALDEEGRDSLRRILMAYACHNPSVGYCQAMNFFAGLLLLLMPEENAFWTLVGIVDDYFDGYFTHEMIESQVDQLVFEELMRERFPKLVNHLDYLGVEVAWVSGPWFLSIFVNMLPWESVLRVWDVLLFEGNRVMLFRTALALMELYGPALVTTKDAADAITLLQSLTGSTFDSSQLVLTACMGFLAVTEARLEELRKKHRPSVLGIIEERTKGNEVSSDSKLASKLYSFKHDSQTLIKEPDINNGHEKLHESVGAGANHSPDNFDEFMCALGGDLEIDSGQDLQEQVVWLKVELCQLMEEKRLATLRAEELETAFLEMVKQDNRRELSARVEQLEQEVVLLSQALNDKQEQEHAMLQVLMRVEQEQKLTEEARIAAEQEVAAQKYAVHVLQEKYDNAMASIAEMEKRVVMAESMLQATLQYESGQAKAHSSPRAVQPESPRAGRRTGLLPFGLGWRDRSKAKSPTEEYHEESKFSG